MGRHGYGYHGMSAFIKRTVRCLNSQYPVHSEGSMVIAAEKSLYSPTVVVDSNNIYSIIINCRIVDLTSARLSHN